MENKEQSIRHKSLKDTKARRQSMVIKVLSFYIQKNKLDTVKKIDSLLSNFKGITFQDEIVKSWHMNKTF